MHFNKVLILTNSGICWQQIADKTLLGLYFRPFDNSIRDTKYHKRFIEWQWRWGRSNTETEKLWSTQRKEGSKEARDGSEADEQSCFGFSCLPQCCSYHIDWLCKWVSQGRGATLCGCVAGCADRWCMPGGGALRGIGVTRIVWEEPE